MVETRGAERHRQRGFRSPRGCAGAGHGHGQGAGAKLEVEGEGQLIDIYVGKLTTKNGNKR